MQTVGAPSPFVLLSALHGDGDMAEIWSAEAAVQGWLAAEAALARAQGGAGVLEAQVAHDVASACDSAVIDQADLWAEARNVGYPILPLVRAVASSLSGDAAGRVHYGATTQDIMDTGLALQLTRSAERLRQLIERLGDALATVTHEHASTVMAGRTHAQQAVPTTFGAKTGVLLAELARHRTRLDRAADAVRVVSLHGAAGTSAALGPRAAEVRRRMADDLGLRAEDVPWHVARDGIAELAGLCAMLAGSATRLAREVVDLSRTEIGEVREAGGLHRGASSTMPQKANPISSEAVIGFGVTATALAGAVPRCMEGGHERAAGEWQVEWYVLPHLLCATAGALSAAVEVVEGLQVFASVMRSNLDCDNGLVMAEAWMIRLAEELGREDAHDVVYAAAARSRESGARLVDAVPAVLAGRPGVRAPELALEPEQYLGSAVGVAEAAVRLWRGEAT